MRVSSMLTHLSLRDSLTLGFRAVTASVCNAHSSCTSAGLRTHTCGELTSKHVGEHVTLCGWLYSTRMSKTFLLIKDTYGLTQVLLNGSLKCCLPSADSVIKVQGIVKQRPTKDINSIMKTGEIEIKAESIKVLNQAAKNIPFKMKDNTKVSEQLGLEYRYLQLRNTEFQERIRFRSQFILCMRNFLCSSKGFVDVETPYLFKKTPGGAQEFIVPTQYRGKFYSLPQSPQQFKQLLMVSGFDRYMQIARCFRDELARPDRQPEFTQLDIEASFITKEDIYEIIESTLNYAWSAVIKYNKSIASLQIPFPRLSYNEAMMRFGSDKPDVRFGMELQDAQCGSGSPITFFIISDEYNRKLSRAFLQKLRDLVDEKCNKKIYILSYADLPKTSEELRSAFSLVLKAGESAVWIKGSQFSEREAVGTARLLVAKNLDSQGISIYASGFFFHWVENFPLFSKNDEGSLVSEHHPFTAPVESEVDKLYSQPEKVHGQHYDLVCNGQEVGGGSLRIHDPGIQHYVLAEILKEDVESLQHLLDALSFGAPPHGGIALGLDRLVAIITGSSTVRDVIAFPKTLSGRDLLSNSPDSVPQADLDRYFIQIAPEKE